MRIGLACFPCRNRDASFNLAQIGRAMRAARGRADLLCFGEAFLQGFDALCWEYETDRHMAVEQDSAPMQQLRAWTEEYGVALLTGYLERAEDRLYSSCAILADGGILHNYRRISRGWKEFRRTDGHYREGDDTAPFRFREAQITIALCGDLWDAPERFRTGGLLIWPVYCSYSPAEWEAEQLSAYAAQAALAADRTLMVNVLDEGGDSHGGCCLFRNGQAADRLPFGEEGILYVTV